MIPALVATRTAAGRGSTPPPRRLTRLDGRHRPDRGVGISLATLSGVASAGLLSYGIWLLATARSTPQHDGLPDYVRAVAGWPDARVGFAELHVTVRSNTQDAARVRLTPEDIPDDDTAGAEDLPGYQALVFRARSSAAGGPQGLVPAVRLDRLREQLEEARSKHLQQLYEHVGPNVSFEFSVDDGPQTSTFLVGPYSLVRVRLVAALGPRPSDKCRQQLKGFYSGGRCWILSRLKSICVQVAMGEDGWQPVARSSDRARSNGCAYVAGDPGQWESAAYELLPATRVEDSGIFADLVIELRSRDDPHLRALELTQGSLDLRKFGADDRVVGFIFLGLFVVFAVPPCVIAALGGQAAAPRTLPRTSGPAARSVGRRYAGLIDDLDNLQSRGRC